MKTKNLILSFLVVALLWSCSDESDMTVILKESGELKVELTQNETPVSETMVYLIPQMNFRKSESYIDDAIDMQKTNEDGIADFGEVNSGNYYVATEEITVGSLIYIPERTVQVISDTKKTYSIEVLDYTGTITINVVDYYSYNAMSDVHVALIPQDILNSTDTQEEAIAAAFDEKITGASGTVTFELPSGHYYYAIVYILEGEDIVDYTTESIDYLSIGEELNDYVYLYF